MLYTYPVPLLRLFISGALVLKWALIVLHRKAVKFVKIEFRNCLAGVRKLA